MFVILTNFFVQLVVENLLKVLKTQVFHILYFLDYCLFARVCTLRARARIVIIDCLSYHSGSPLRRGARRKGGRKPICGPPLLYMIVFWLPLVWCPLCWGNLSFARKGLLISCVCFSRFESIYQFASSCCLVDSIFSYFGGAFFGRFTSLLHCVFCFFSCFRKS